MRRGWAFFDFVEKQGAVVRARHALAQQAAFMGVASQQQAQALLGLAFRHIKAEQPPFAHQVAGEDDGGFRLAHARGAKQQKAALGTVWRRQPQRAAPEDGRHADKGRVLAANGRGQMDFQARQQAADIAAARNRISHITRFS